MDIQPLIENTPHQYRKHAEVALFWAILFGPCTWIYTLRKDAWKAALGLGLAINFIVFGAVIFIGRARLAANPDINYEGYEVIGWFVISVPVFFVIWSWAFIDTASKTDAWFKTHATTRKKTLAVTLSVLVGPWTWLYTYSKDNWKFWLSILVGYGFVLINALTGIPYFMAVWIVGCLTIWVVSIVTAARRNQNWYEALSSVSTPTLLHTRSPESNKRKIVAIVSSCALIAIVIVSGFLTNQPPKEGTMRWYSEKAEQSLSAGRGAEKSGQHIEAEKYFQEAIGYLSEAILLSPNDMYLFSTRGYTYFKMKDYQRALQDNSEAIRLSPNSSELYYNRSLTYENLNMNALAIADLEKCIELTKDNSLKEIYRGRISTLSK